MSEAQTVYDMMNRFDTSRDMNNVERSAIFIQMLLYWRGVLNEAEPDLVIFPAPPHVVYDYVVLALCRELGVQTLMFEEATIVPPLPDRNGRLCPRRCGPCSCRAFGR